MEEKKVNIEAVDTAPAKRSLPKWALIGGGIALLLLLMVLFSGGEKVDMEDYISVDFSGVDGRGTAEIYVDYAALSDLACSDKKGDRKFMAELQAEGGKLAVDACVQHAVVCTADRGSDLSNGDRIKVQTIVDEELCKKLGLKIKPQELSYTVEELLRVTGFDAFEGIDVTFSGIAPYGWANLVDNSTDEITESYHYQLDKENHLSNGDVVTVSIDKWDAEDMAHQTGRVPAQMSKEFTVSGLPSYVTDFSQVSPEALDSMKQQVEDEQREVFESMFFFNQRQGHEFAGTKIIDTYMVTSTSDDGGGMPNALGFVCENTYQNHENGNNFEAKYYCFMAFRNVYCRSDGTTVVDLSNYFRRSTHQFDILVSEDPLIKYTAAGFPSVEELDDDLKELFGNDFTFVKSSAKA